MMVTRLIILSIIWMLVNVTADGTVPTEVNCLCKQNDGNCSRVIENDSVFYLTYAERYFKVNSTETFTTPALKPQSIDLVQCWDSQFAPKSIVIKRCKVGENLVSAVTSPTAEEHKQEYIYPWWYKPSHVYVCKNSICTAFYVCITHDNGSIRWLKNYTSSNILELLLQRLNFPEEVVVISVDDVPIVIESTMFRNFGQLHYLSLSGAQLSHVPVLPEPRTLFTISLIGCNITEIPSHSFTNQNFLSALNLDHNLISTLGICTPRTARNFLEKKRWLEFLTLRNNRISKICPNFFQFNPRLRIILLRRNDISSITGVFATEDNKIEVLDLSRNKLEYISNEDFIFLRQLRRLTLSQNHIQFIEISAFQSIDYHEFDLNVADNLLTTTDFLNHMSRDTSLVTLRHNAIQNIPKLTSNLRVIELDLSFNRISYVGLRDLTLLDYQNINLTYNSVKKVDFQGLNEKEYSSGTIDLNFNPLICDCFAKPLLDYVKDKTDSSPFWVNKLSCHEPQSLRDTLFKSLDERFLYCSARQNCPVNCTCQFAKEETVVYCNSNNIKNIPTIVPQNASSLNMNFNDLTTLRNLDKWTSLQSLELEHCLDFDEMETSDVMDLNRLTNLTMLSIQYNKLNVLPDIAFVNLTQLSILKLGNNLLPNLPATTLKSLTHLTQVFINNNQLEALDEKIFETSHNLQEIYACCNKFSSIKMNISHLSGLRFLDFSENNLESVEIEWPNNVTTILLRGNRIKSLNLENLPQTLHFLDLRDNRLVYFDLTKFQHIDHSNSMFDFSNNQISHISDVSFEFQNSYENIIVLNNNPIQCDCRLESFLKYLRTRNNELKLFVFKIDKLYCNSPKFMKNKIVEDLDIAKLLCEQNQCIAGCECFKLLLSEYRVMECASFPKVRYRTDETVNEVHVRNVGSVNLMQLQSSYWDSLNSITLQKIIYTNVTTAVFSNMTNLTIIKMTNNENLQFSEKVFSGLSKLITLNLNSNGLIHLNNYSFLADFNLQYLNLSYNSLNALPLNIFADLNSLRTLDLSFNNLTDLQTKLFVNSTSLKRLLLRRNYIASLRKMLFNKCTSLEMLDLSENLITTLESMFLPQTITYVNLSRNFIKNIEYDWFNLRSLRTIDLSFNSITIVNASELIRFSRGATFKLQNNKIPSVIWMDGNNDESYSFVTANLENNPFVCDCNLTRFVKIISEDNFSPLRIENRHNMNCFHPPELANLSLTNLRSVNLYCKLENCPIGCDCKHYAHNEINVIRCNATIDTDFSICPSVVDELYLNGSTSVQYLRNECWKLLKKLYVKNNYFVGNVSSNFLRNHGQLTELGLSECGIAKIPSKLFQFSLGIEIIVLRKNSLQKLPPKLFENLLNLKEIDVSGNQLILVDWQIPLSLQSLNLAENRIVNVSIPKFNEHYQLKFFNLSSNQLKEVPNRRDYLFHLKHLQVLDLSHNEISIECNNQTLIFPQYLRSLNLSHNAINCTHFWSELNKPHVMFRNFDLSHNFIETFRISDFMFCNHSQLVVGVTNCSIKKYELNVSHLKNELWDVMLNVDISSNEVIECDCDIREYSDSKRIQSGNLSLTLQLVSGNTCDLTHFDVNVDLLSKFGNLPNSNYCAIVDNCSSNCICLKSGVVISMFCVRKNLVSLPSIFPVNVEYLNLDYNNITVLKGLDDPKWKNLVTISLRRNRMTSIANDKLTALENLKFVFLDGNLLHSPSGWLEYFVTEDSLKFKITLSDNPWSCTCDNSVFKNWVTHFAIEQMILDVNNTFCSNGNLLVKFEFCPVRIWKILLPVIAASIVIITMLILTVLYHRKKMLIHAWCYGKNLCGCCVNEDAVDADKEFDAFISYCEEDAEYVSQKLLPGLEEQKPFYKVCIHHRDWTAGVPIVEQIESSIKNSRRVIMVLSRNFANSPWANLEFRVANMQSIEDKINRVIAITLDQDFLTDDLDPEFRAYLTMTTYLKANDVQFWNKLRYVMPHKARTRANLPRKTDSKLELVEIAEDTV